MSRKAITNTIAIITLIFFFAVSGQWDYSDAKQRDNAPYSVLKAKSKQRPRRGVFDGCIVMVEPYRARCIDFQAWKIRLNMGY
jgi:hypothetical protein